MLPTLTPPALHQHLHAPQALTPAELHAETKRAMRSVYHSPQRTLLLQLVAEYGVLTADQLYRLCRRDLTITSNFKSFERTLARLCQREWLAIVPRLANELIAQGYQWPGATRTEREQRLRGYVLGQVGTALIPGLWPLLGRNPRGILPPDSLVHDALCAEVLLRLVEGQPDLHPCPPAAAALWDAEKQVFFGRPDGLVLRYDGLFPTTGGWVVEFCNEPWTAPERAQQKLGRYVELHHSRRWEAWGVPWLPDLLVVYRHPSTARTFAELAPPIVGALHQVWGLALADVLRPAAVARPRLITNCANDDE